MIWHRGPTSDTRDSDFCACCGFLLHLPSFPWQESVLGQTQTSSFFHRWDALLICHDIMHICWKTILRYALNKVKVGAKSLFFLNQVFMRILQHLLPGAPRSLLELRFACFGRISRSSRGNCACTQRWQTWRRRGGGWQHWRRQRCWSRLGRTCPGSSAARSEVQSSKWGPRLETAWHRAPAIEDLGCSFLKICSQFDCEVWMMNKKLCPGWSRCP